MSRVFSLVLLSCLAETRGAWISNNNIATKQSVRYALQANGNDAFALSGQVLPQGILGDFREASVNKIPWKGPGAVGFKEPEAIREMTVFDRSLSPTEVTEKEQAAKQQQGGLKDVSPSVTESVVAETKKEAVSVPQLESSEPSDAKKGMIERVPFFQRADPGFMSPDVIATVRINEQQNQLPPSTDAASFGASNRKARDAAILRFEASSWAAENIKSEKASADVLTRVNIGIGAPIAAKSSLATTTNSKQGVSKGAQDWTSAVKPSKDSADVLVNVKLYDEIVNVPASQQVQTTNILTPPDQPDVFNKVNINEGSVAKNPGSAAKPSKESADVLTSVKIHEDVKLTQAAKPSKDSADVQTSVKIHQSEMLSQTAKPAKESADVLNSVKINPDTKDGVSSTPAQGVTPSSVAQMQGDKQDIVKPFDKSNSQPPIVEPILVDKLPKSNYKNDLDDIITVESKDDDKTTVSNESEDMKGTPSATMDAAEDKAEPAANKSSDLERPVEIQAKSEPISVETTSEEPVESLNSIEVTKNANPVPIAKPYKESADVLTPVKIHADAQPAQLAKPVKDSADVQTPVKIHAEEKPRQVATPLKDSADVLTPVKIHADAKPTQFVKPSKDSADVLTPVKIHAEEKPPQIAKPIKDSADVLTSVKIHADTKPAQRGTPIKDSADVQIPIKIHAEEKPVQSVKPVKDSADVQTRVQIHADAKPAQRGTPTKDSADIQTPVKIHAEEKPRQIATSLKDSADVLTPVKIHANAKPTQFVKPSKESADVLTPVKIHADSKPVELPKPTKDSADVLKSVKIHETVKTTKVINQSDESKSSTVNGTKDAAPTKPPKSPVVSEKEPMKASSNKSKKEGDKTPSKNGKTNGENGSNRNADVAVGGVQNDSVKGIYASLVAADVITGVKMYGDRIPVPGPSASDSASSSGSKWKSDFDPNRWAPITY